MNASCELTALDLRPDVHRQVRPDRLILWVPGDREGRWRHWWRVRVHLPPQVAARDGVCVAAADVAPLREEVHGGLFGWLLGAFGRNEADGWCRLPAAGWAVLAGAVGKPALLAWTRGHEEPLAAGRIATLWPSREAGVALGPRLFLVVGATLRTSVVSPAVGPAARPQGYPVAPAAAAQDPLERCEALGRAAVRHTEEGRYWLALGEFTEVCSLTRRHIGEGHTHYAQALLNLGAIQTELAACATAEPLLRKALEILRAEHRTGNWEEVIARYVLGKIAFGRGDFTAAEGLYQEALAVVRSRTITSPVAGKPHPLEADVVHVLAEVHAARGDHAAAEALFTQSLEIRRAVLGEGHKDAAPSLVGLADVLSATGRCAEAEALCQQALEIRRAAPGGMGHPESARALDGLAAVYRRRGDAARAEPLCRQAFATRREALGEDHPDVARSLHHLAQVRRALGDVEQAESLLTQAVAGYRRVLDETHPDLARALVEQTAVGCGR